MKRNIITLVCRSSVIYCICYDHWFGRLWLFQMVFVVCTNLSWDVLTQPLSHFCWSLSTIYCIFLASGANYDEAFVIVYQTLTLPSLEALFWDALITDLFSQGYTIPLDKRLAADGRGLQQVHINENFAKLAEALYIADRKVSCLEPYFVIFMIMKAQVLFSCVYSSGIAWFLGLTGILIYNDCFAFTV